MIIPFPFLPPKEVWFSSRKLTWERLYPSLKGKPTGQRRERKTKTDCLREIRDILRAVTNSIQAPPVVEKIRREAQEQLKKLRQLIQRRDGSPGLLEDQKRAIG